MADSDDEYGEHYEKIDVERVGFFDDTPQGPWDQWAPPRPGGGLRENLKKGPQMMCRLKGGLFERHFQRIYTGECLPELSLGPKRKGKKKKKAEPLGIIMPPGYPKWHSCPGDWGGCLGKQPQRFSPETKPPPKRPQRIPPNAMTRPNPRGGPGYLKITINPYVPIQDGPEPYDPEFKKEARDDGPRRFVSMCLPKDYFDENPFRPGPPLPDEDGKSRRKSKGRLPEQPKPIFHLHFPPPHQGPKSGCFWNFPRYWFDPIPELQRRKKKKGLIDKVPWVPPGPELTTKYTTSIIQKVTMVSCNSQNFPDYKEQAYPLY